MLNPMRDKNEGTYRRGEGMTPVTRGLSRRSLTVKTFYELSWKVKVMIKYIYQVYIFISWYLVPKKG